MGQRPSCHGCGRFLRSTTTTAAGDPATYGLERRKTIENDGHADHCPFKRMAEATETLQQLVETLTNQ